MFMFMSVLVLALVRMPTRTQEDMDKSAQKLQEAQHSVSNLKHLYSKSVRVLQRGDGAEHTYMIRYT